MQLPLNYAFALLVIVVASVAADTMAQDEGAEVHLNEFNYDDVVGHNGDLLDQEITTFGTFGGFCRDRDMSQKILFPIYAPGTAVIGECVFDSPLMGRATLETINDVAKLDLGQSIAVHGKLAEYNDLDNRSIIDFAWVKPSDRTEAIQLEEEEAQQPAETEGAAAEPEPTEPKSSRAPITNHTDKSVRVMIAAHASRGKLRCEYVEPKELEKYGDTDGGVETTMVDDGEFLKIDLDASTWLSFTPTSATLTGEFPDGGLKLLSFHVYADRFTYSYLDSGLRYDFVCVP